MTKADLIAVIAEKLKFPWARAEVLVDQIFEAMVEALKRGEGIEIRGFGSFTIREYKAYEGRNPRTGETVQVKPKRLAFFKVGKELRERVNNGREGAQGGGNAAPGGSGGAGGGVPTAGSSGSSGSSGGAEPAA